MVSSENDWLGLQVVRFAPELWIFGIWVQGLGSRVGEVAALGVGL